jgi:hypothetical protein
VTGDVVNVFAIVGNGTCIGCGTVCGGGGGGGGGCSSLTPAARLVVIVLALFLDTLSCSDFVWGYQKWAPIPKNIPNTYCRTIMCL